MRRSFILSLCSWHVFAGSAFVDALYLQPRQRPVSSPAAPAAAVESSSTAPVTTTVFEGENKDYSSAPATTSTPASGCLLNTRAASTSTFEYLQASSSVSTNVVTVPEGHVCLCAGGTRAGAESSQDNRGTEYWYCQTGTTASRSAVSTSDPEASADPGNPLNPDVSNTLSQVGKRS